MWVTTHRFGPCQNWEKGQVKVISFKFKSSRLRHRLIFIFHLWTLSDLRLCWLVFTNKPGVRNCCSGRIHSVFALAGGEGEGPSFLCCLAPCNAPAVQWLRPRMAQPQSQQIPLQQPPRSPRCPMLTLPSCFWESERDWEKGNALRHAGQKDHQSPSCTGYGGARGSACTHVVSSGSKGRGVHGRRL